VYARVTNLRFPPAMRTEVIRVAQGLAPLLVGQQGFRGLNVLTDPEVGEGIIISFWESEADAKASESSASYIGQMSMMSSFLHAPLSPKTYEANIRA
jgi:heme-degrading monooxygenase HmoA